MPSDTQTGGETSTSGAIFWRIRHGPVHGPVHGQSIVQDLHSPPI